MGPFGAKVMLLFILIAVAGTLNGVILGYLRLPHALAKRGLLPLSRIFAEPRAFLRALPAYTASCVWAALNYLSERYAWLPNADVSEIPIVMGYLLYAVLYVQVIRLWNQGEIIGFWHGVSASESGKVSASFAQGLASPKSRSICACPTASPPR